MTARNRASSSRAVSSTRSSSHLSLEEPAPEIAAVRSHALLAVNLHVEFALLQALDLILSEIDRARQHAAGRLRDRQIGDRVAACALGDAPVKPCDGCRSGEA